MKITKDMSITEIIQQYPQTHQVFTSLRLGCLGCIAASFETLEAGLNAHGIDVESTVKMLNDAVNAAE